MNDKVKIFRYVTEGTFDSYSWQLIENKQKFIGQIMTSKSPVRSCEDIDEAALTYAEVKALATGNPYIKEKMDLDIQVSKLKLLKANHTSQKYRLEDNIVKHYPVQIAAMKERIAGYRADIQTYAQNKLPDKDTFSIKIGNRVYTDKKEAGAALIDMCRSAKQPNMAVTIGEYQGFVMNVTFDSFLSRFKVNMKGSISHEVEIGADPLGNLQRLGNALDGMAAKMETLAQQLENVEHQLEIAKVEVIKPFAQEEELEEKLERLAELNSLLNMDEKNSDTIGMEDDTFESESGDHNFVLDDADFIGSSGLQEEYRVGLEYIIENVQSEYADEQKRVDIITGYNKPLRPFVMEDDNHRIEVMPVKEDPKEMLAYINSLKEEGCQVFYHFLDDVNSLINPQKFPLGKSNATYLAVKFSKCATGFSHIYVDTSINQVNVIENKMAFYDMAKDVKRHVETPTITCEWSEHPAFQDGKTYSVLEFDSLMRKCDEEWSDGYKTALKKYGSVDAMFDAEDTAYVGYAKTKFTVNMPDGSHITERQDIGDGVGGVIDFLKQYPQYKDVARNLQQAVNREENRNKIGRKTFVKGL